MVNINLLIILIGTWSENSPSGNGASYSPRYNKLRPIAFISLAPYVYIMFNSTDWSYAFDIDSVFSKYHKLAEVF